jgi:hypothetical protein
MSEHSNDQPAPVISQDAADLGEGGYMVELQPGMTAEVIGYLPEDDAK